MKIKCRLDRDIVPGRNASDRNSKVFVVSTEKNPHDRAIDGCAECI